MEHQSAPDSLQGAITVAECLAQDERAILLLNAGSSSLKCDLFSSNSGERLFAAQADWASGTTRWRMKRFSASGVSDSGWRTVAWSGSVGAVSELLEELRRLGFQPERDLAAVGHRVVHGGDFCQAMRIDPVVQAEIRRLAELAPLHNTPCLESLDVIQKQLPGVTQVAVFDSAFHATLPEEVSNYPLPYHWNTEWHIRRYGFHGLSHAWCSRRAEELLGDCDSSDSPRCSGPRKLVICHLGHGCSATAVRGGVSIDTTMGFTPLEGLMMATRCGSIDPGIVPYVQTQYGLTAAECEEILNRKSGLAAVSGLSADMRELLQAASSGHARAALAIAMYVHRIRGAIGSLAATLGGIDALVFTAGVGENSPQIRELVCERLEFLGLRLDSGANATCQPDADIATEDSPARILVLQTREELEMLRQVRMLLGAEEVKHRGH